MSRRTLTYHQLDAGLLQSLPGETVPNGFTPSCRNVELTENGRLRMPRRGYRRFASSALSAGYRVDGLWHLVRQDGTRATVAACNGGFYRIKATGEVETLGTGYESGAWSGAIYQGKLLLAHPLNEPLIYDTALEDLADQEDVTLPNAWESGNWPSQFVLIAAGKNERLAALGFNEDPSAIYFSALQSYLDWTADADAFQLRPRRADGESIMAVASYQDIIVAMKETHSVLYYGVDPTASGAALTDIAEGVRDIPLGCASPRSVVKIENDILWWSQDGPVALSTVQSYGDVAGDVMRARLPESLKVVAPTRREQIVGYYNGDYVRFSVPRRSSVENATNLDYYPKRVYKDPQGTRQGAWFVGDGLPIACAITLDAPAGPLTLFGDYSGWINEIHGLTDNGTGIACEYHFPDFDSGGQFDVIRADFLISEGGGGLKGYAQFDDGSWSDLGGSLTPSFPGDEAPAVSRKTPYGGGRRLGFKIARSGGTADSVINGLIAEIDVKGVK